MIEVRIDPVECDIIREVLIWPSRGWRDKKLPKNENRSYENAVCINFSGCFDFVWDEVKNGRFLLMRYRVSISVTKSMFAQIWLQLQFRYAFCIEMTAEICCSACCYTAFWRDLILKRSTFKLRRDSQMNYMPPINLTLRWY